MTPVNPRVLDSLNYGIAAEIKSYVFYIEAAKVTKDQKHREILLRLAGDEKEHYHILERQHHSLIKSEQWVSYNDILKEKGLPEINEDMADIHRELLDKVRAAKGEREILTIALGLEEDANRLFTKAASEAKNPEEKGTYEFLANFEKGHVKIIQGMIESL
jgi:rubrerythrin